MDSTFSFVVSHANYAHWVVFGLFMLAGCNFPVSEDLLIIVSGFLASAIVPENAWKLFAAVFLGAYLSDFIPYYLGRRFGHNLWRIPWFSRMIKMERLEQVKNYYTKYGVLTLIIGRFIPFGVRNCLFLSAGLGKMSFLKFVISDGIACLCSNGTLFMLAYFFSRNYMTLSKHLKLINIVIFSAFVVALITLFWYKKSRSTEKEMD